MSNTALDKKLSSVELNVSQALVRETVSKLRSLISSMAGEQPNSQLGYKLRIIDGTARLLDTYQSLKTRFIAYLYHNPQERLRLGKNAKQYAEQIFGAENAAKQLNPIYHRLMETPKRTRQWSIPDERKITNTIKFRIGFI